jgi:hypothetical protein
MNFTRNGHAANTNKVFAASAMDLALCGLAVIPLGPHRRPRVIWFQSLAATARTEDGCPVV